MNLTDCEAAELLTLHVHFGNAYILSTNDEIWTAPDR